MRQITPISLSTEPVEIAPRTTYLIALVLLFVFTSLLVTSIRQESQTFDEAAHLFAGFEYWKHADFGRNPEHPPLVKFLVAVPLLSMGLKEPAPLPIPFFKAQDFINSSQFLYSADADGILLRGRLVIALFSLALAVLVFFADREMFNPLTALIALGLFSFEPVLLANGALVTTDMPLACLFFASVYTFYRYLKAPSLPRLALCAVATALTLTAKHSGILILPTLLLLAVAELFTASSAHSAAKASERPRHGSSRPPLRLAYAIGVIAICSLLFLWAIYGFRYAARPGQLQIVSNLAAYSAGLHHPLEQNVIAFLAHHHLLPEAYLFGWVDILLIPGFRPSFLFGHLFPTGKWFFFPAVFLIKSTLTLLILLLLLPFARIRDRRRELTCLVVPAVFFLVAAIVSMVNLGVRHILPLYPFCIVVGAAAAAAIATRSTMAKAAVAALLLLTVISSLHTFPDFLAYSNEFAGGPSRTYRITTDANADWGQGLKWTRTWLDQHPSPDCWFNSYLPLVDPAYYGIRCKPLLSSFAHMAGVASAPIPRSLTGTVLVSSADYAGLWWGPDSLNPYRSPIGRKPDTTIGNIILVYRGTFDLPLLAAQTNAVAASALVRQHRLPEALVLAQTAVQEAPDSAEVNASLAEVLFASGRTAEAQQSRATALHLAQTIHPEFQKRLIASLQLPPPGR